MDIRLLRGENENGNAAMFAQAFEFGDRNFDSWNKWKAANPDRSVTVSTFDEAGLEAVVFLVNYAAHFGPDVVVPLAGVDGVVTLPAARGKGYASKGIRRALEVMRETGQAVSMLIPFDWDFYRHYGWEWVGRARRYILSPDVLQVSPETEWVRAAKPEDRPAICTLYTRFAARYRGMLQRREYDWDEILNDKPEKFTYTYLYEEEGEPLGYLTFRFGDASDSEKSKTTHLREFIALTPRAQRGLLGLLRRHAMQVEKFGWRAPEDDPLWVQAMTKGIETQCYPLWMGRMVDLLVALPLWKPKAGRSGTLTLAVTDTFAPWNAGTWRVSFADQQVTVAPTQEAPQITLDIQALTQAYWGTPTVAELAAAERLTVHDPSALPVLADLFHGPPMYINDTF